MYLVVSAPLCSFGEGLEGISPMIPVKTAADSTDTSKKVSTIMADSVWAAPFPAIKPSTAMYHSLCIPGWGQINNGKKKKAVLFFAAELSFIGGYLYNNYRIRHYPMSDWERDNLRTDRNTFIIYWMVAKVLGIVDAYVDAHLANFDVEDITPQKLQKPEP